MINSRYPMFVAWGPQLAFLYNDAYAPIFGKKHPSALGLPFREVWSDIWSDIEPLVDKALAGQATYHENLHLVMERNGYPEDTWYSFSYSPVRDESGGVAGMFCACTETTQNVLVERRKAEERERLARMFQQAPGFITILSGPEHRFEFVNDAYVRLFGDRSFVGKTVREAFPELAGQGFYEWLDRVYATGERFVASQIPITLDLEDGSTETRVLDFVYAPVADERGETGIFCEGYDVTEAHKSREALAASEARFRLMADAVPAIVWVTDAEGRTEFFNRQWYDYTGADPSPTTAGQVSDNYVHPDDGKATMAAFGEAQRTGTTYRVEHRIRSRAGEYRWFLVRGEPHRDEATGKIICWFGASVDIHDRRQAEAALSELNETLESRVTERTAELEHAHEQLRQSQKMEAMGALTGGVAHDFNNLLTPIVGSLDLLQRKGLGGDRERRLIDGAIESAERARLLVQRLLAFARRQPLQPRPVDMSTLVSGMADLVASTTGPQIKVVFDVAPELPAAVADPNQVEMAILNLSVNARDAMPDGGTLRISAVEDMVHSGHRSRLVPGRYVRLSVADTGTGMDEATLARAVEPFFSTKGVGRGTGLGLSMVHGLASQLGGALTIDSRPGLGTNIEVWLPASTSRPDEQADPDEAPARVSAAGTALLVDDEPLVRASTADMLSELGYAVVEASSAEEALRLVDRGLALDLLVTDHLMPGMNGTELARELRGRMAGLRVLLVSGYAEADGVAPELARLIKPFRQTDLVTKLSELENMAA